MLLLCYESMAGACKILYETVGRYPHIDIILDIILECIGPYWNRTGTAVRRIVCPTSTVLATQVQYLLHCVIADPRGRHAGHTL